MEARQLFSRGRSLNWPTVGDLGASTPPRLTTNSSDERSGAVGQEVITIDEELGQDRERRCGRGED